MEKLTINKRRYFFFTGVALVLTVLGYCSIRYPLKRRMIVNLVSQELDERAISMAYYSLTDDQYAELVELNSSDVSTLRRVEHIYEFIKASPRGGFITKYNEKQWEGRLPRKYCLVYCSSIYSPTWVALCPRGSEDIIISFNDANYLMSSEREMLYGRIFITKNLNDGMNQ